MHQPTSSRCHHAGLGRRARSPTVACDAAERGREHTVSWHARITPGTCVDSEGGSRDTSDTAHTPFAPPASSRLPPPASAHAAGHVAARSASAQDATHGKVTAREDAGLSDLPAAQTTIRQAGCKPCTDAGTTDCRRARLRHISCLEGHTDTQNGSHQARASRQRRQSPHPARRSTSGAREVCSPGPGAWSAQHLHGLTCH